MRAFLCIPIKDDLRNYVASVAQELRERVDARAAWVQRENYHVTVRFLGEIDAMLMVDLKRACQEITAQTRPFEIGIDRVGGFPNLDNPRVLWVGGRAPQAFQNLLSQLDKSLSQLGFAHARVETLAHITIARIKGRLHTPLQGTLEGITRPSWALRADRLVLMESRLTPQGAIYSPLFTLGLARREDGV